MRIRKGPGGPLSNKGMGCPQWTYSASDSLAFSRVLGDADELMPDVEVNPRAIQPENVLLASDSEGKSPWCCTNLTGGLRMEALFKLFVKELYA